MRLGLLILLVSAGCTLNLVRHPAEPEVLKQRIDYFKWLYDKGVFRSDTEMMKRAALKLLEVDAREKEATSVDELERMVHRLEAEVERLTRDKR